MTPAELLARILDPADRTGELDWSLVREDFEIHDHELPDSSVHVGSQGWRDWIRDWQQAFEEWTFSGDRLVRMDYYPDFREQEHSWSTPGGGGRRSGL